MPEISGAATSPKWAWLAVSLPVLIYVNYVKCSFTLIHLFGLLFVAWSALTLIWTSNIYDGFDNLIRLIVLTEAFILGSYLVFLRDVFIGLALGLTVSSLLILFDVNVAGLFVNINVLAETAALVLIGLCVYRLWWLVPGLAPAFTNSSRGAILGVGITGCIWLWSKSRFSVLLLLIVLCFIGYVWDRPSSNSERLVLWVDTIEGLITYGQGLGSFFTSYPFFSSVDTLVSRPRYAHNDFLQIAFELGLVGCLLIVGFVVCVITTDLKEKYVFIAFATIACFSFPLYMPVTAFVSVLSAGYIAGRRNSIFVQFNDCRMATQKWFQKRFEIWGHCS